MRPKKDKKDLQTQTIHVKVSKVEKANMEDSARKKGLNLSGYLRWLHSFYGKQ